MIHGGIFTSRLERGQGGEVWIPACAGMTTGVKDGWIPAFTGMTMGRGNDPPALKLRRAGRGKRGGRKTSGISP